MGLMKSWMTLALAIGFAVWAAPTMTSAAEYTLDPDRVNEIAAALPSVPRGPGQPVSDRAFWESVAKEPGFNAEIEAARKFKDTPLPELPDDLYLEFSRNGNRRNFEQVAFSRRNRLTPLVLAECMENTGEFVPAINSLITELCKERTWVLPAHDRKLTNFHGTTITIDLFSSAVAWDLAMVDYLVGEKLQPEVRELMRNEVMRRVVSPFREMIHNKRPNDRWFKMTNNWNAVCFSNVTGAGLILLESQRDRAELITAAEYYSRYFLSGFEKDGYCSEGVGYWNYGYGRYALMAQVFRAQTGDKVDLFALDGAAQPASYGARIEIAQNVFPAFADCSLSAKPSQALLWLLNRVYGWQNPEYAQVSGAAFKAASLYETMVYQEAKRTSFKPIEGVNINGADGIRTIFQKAGVFICRPQNGTDGRFAVAFKGGNNAEQHNHNDIGSYVLVVDGEPLLLDPGPEPYTARTFGPQRYDGKLLNSYGHSVPVVAGKLQRTGRKARGRILKQDFTETTDTVVLNMKSAYEVPELERLTRTFEYGRGGGGVLIVTDHVQFKTPQTFETAMISLGNFANSDQWLSVQVGNGKATANVKIESSAPYEFNLEKIDEGSKPTRLGIKLKEPVTSAVIRMVITDATPQE